MNKHVKVVAYIIFGVIMIVSFYGCVASYKIEEYPVTPNEYKYEIDYNIPLSFDEALLLNPDRGYRGETYITLGSLNAYPSSDIDAYTSLNNAMDRYEQEGVKIMQLYVYLIEYHDRSLDDTALQQLTEYFEYLQEREIRVLLRFAYEYSSTMKIGPKTKQIIDHCKSLGEWFDNNLELANNVIYAMQFGMVGLWGEGHGGVHRHSIPKLAKALVGMTPEPYTIMVRTPEILSKIPKDIKYRFSIHDDFLVGIDHPWGMLSFTHKDYGKLMNRCKYFLTDGEMPWGKDTTVPNIDYILFLRQCVNYGLTTLSIEHNYIEEGNEYHLKKWQSTYITSNELKENNFPYAPFLLVDSKISIYRYLEYHLGYLLSVSNLSRQDGKVSLMITNYGFSAPYDFIIEMHTLEGVKEYDAEMSDLRQFGQLIVNTDTKGQYVGIRLRHKRLDNLTIKLANNIPYVEGFNYIYLDAS